MAKAVSSPILHLIHQVALDPRLRHVSDHDLVQSFKERRDEAAFHALLLRHGPMVLDVCRGVLANEADVEDTFQATFLILARKAASVRKGASVGSWLHGVAYRTALKARAQSATRKKHEVRVPGPQACEPDDLSWREVRNVLHEELTALAERYRAPLVACYLEGMTQDEAAAHLRMATSTLKVRLERGRSLLRARLLRRGLGPVAALTAAAWPTATASACLPGKLAEDTIKAAGLFAAGQSATAGLISDKVVALAEGVLKTTCARKLKAVLAIVLLAALTCVGMGIVIHTTGAKAQDKSAEARGDQSRPAKGDEAVPKKGEARGTEQYRIRVIQGEENGSRVQWVWVDQAVTLGTPFDVRAKDDGAAAKGVLQRTKDGGLHFKGDVRLGYHVGAVDAPVELGNAVVPKKHPDTPLAVSGFVRFELPQPEGAEKAVKVIKKASDLSESVSGGRGALITGGQLLVVPGPRPAQQTPSQWFQDRIKADNALTADQETWLLYRSQQFSDYDRMSIERIEQQGNTFTVITNRALYLGPLYRNVTYHEVHGINLGKLPAGEYTVEWIIRQSAKDGTKEPKPAGCWGELKETFTVRATQEREQGK